MATESKPQRSSLPQHLASADRVWQGDRAKRFFAASIKWVVLSLLLLIILDLIFHLSPWARLGGVGLLIVGIVGIFVAMLWIALAVHSPLERIARILEDRSPELGSKLINLIQLQDQIQDPNLPRNTRALAQRAVEQADESLADFKLPDIAQTPLTKSQIRSALLPILGLIILMGIFFKVTTIQALRFIDPFGNHPPFAFTTLAITTPQDDGLSVIYKDNTVIEVKWSGHDPKDLFLTTWNPEDVEGTKQILPMIRKAEKTYVQQLENITNNLVLVAHNKDQRAISSQRKISVLLTPQIEKSELTISLPEYTNSKSKQIPYHYKTIQTLTESKLTFEITSNRPLESGEIKVTTTDGDISNITMTPKQEAPETVVGSIMARSSARLDFSVKDISGAPSEALLTGGLTVTNDLAPSIRITEPSDDSFIIITHSQPITIEADDDYGLKTLRLHRGLNDRYSPPLTVDLESTGKRHQYLFDLDLPKLGVESGDVISFFAEAIDNAPNPKLARSETRHLIVISEEEYNEMMRTQTDLSMLEEKFDRLSEDFDQLVEEQQRITEELEKIATGESNLSEEEQQKQLDKLLSDQAKLNQALEDHANKMDNFSRKKPLYDMERDLQNRLNDRAEELRESAKNNQQSVDQAKKESDPQTAKQAAKEQLENLQGSQQEQKEQVEKPLEDMAKMHELMNDFNHFKELYDQQEQVAKQTEHYKSGRQLDNNDRLGMQELAAREESIRQQLEELSEKLKKDAEAAKENFPKAAESGEELAEKIDKARLPKLAENAGSSMLAGKGQESADRAERLRSEMEKIMGECSACQGGGQSMGDEIDQYLSAAQMNPGQTFSQMMQSRMFGQNQGQGQGMGMGGQGMGSTGTGGRMGTTNSPNMGMLGGDSELNRSGGKGTRSNNKGEPGEGGAGTAGDKADSLPEIRSVTRESKAVTPEILAEQYRGLVEEYFRAITRPDSKPQPTNNR